VNQAAAPVVSNREVVPGTYLIWLESPEIAGEASPGQFVMVRCGDDTTLPRPLSIHQQDGGRIALLFQVIGKGTGWLSRRQAGNTVSLFGPLGNGFSIEPTARNLLLVAGGIGITPLYYLAQCSVTMGKAVTLLYGTASAARYHLGPIEGNVDIIPATEDGSVGHTGLATDLLARHAPGADQVFACGPPGMYRTMYRMPELQGKPVQVSLEIMMGCGLGVCYGCTVRTRRGLEQVCREGPVFELADLITAP
jgi:dihydroorotate dehydrogenase electron transfer subunit